MVRITTRAMPMSVMISIVRDKRAMRRSGLGSGVAGDDDMGKLSFT
jgi:hypothetical protein